MSLRRNSSHRRRASQEAGAPYPAVNNDGVFSGMVTRSRARMMAAMIPSNVNLEETQLNVVQAPSRTETSSPPRAVRYPEPPTTISNGMQFASRRLTKELLEISRDPPENCSARLIGDNILNWEATLIGPADSPYENGVFKLILDFPVTYPFDPPLIRFETKIYHSNISDVGEICLDVLDCRWSPVLGVSKLLLSILSLLTDPNPDDALEPDAAEAYLRNRKAHDAIARQWTRAYARNN